MICPHCQKENGEFATVCGYCGKSLYLTGADQYANPQQTTQNTIPQQPSQPVVYCSTCGNPCHPNAVVCVKCGSTINRVKPNKVEVDEVVPALKWISFFIPIVGLILFIMKIQSAPNSAKTYGKMALIGWILGIVSVFVISFFSSMMYYMF
mgnify:CR=1 FL=1